MLSVHGRKTASVVIEPVARKLLDAGLTPNAVTLVGTIIPVITALVLIPLDLLVPAALIIGLISALDMVDGTMARLSGGGTRFGATFDASCDRITDGAIFAAITWWLVYVHDAHQAVVAASFGVLVASQVISYIKARGEASRLRMVGGLIERPERLIIGLVGLGLQGFGVPYALEIAIWVLLIGSVFTVGQRFHMALTSPNGRERIAPPVETRAQR
ncbi:phosphatidylglycerophosphate synthase [Corynebacterium yudongzhengii]|uniref:Phosphatidylinositol phosphate synthase n=1 Tax=Corynebacterium yudongzhengii TaxID=2080740 RepID=A0A2U1T4X0_9CORY|nr:CDP-alcohol phosphatidyltransferase family protein [Corynebacterium yudongzhengii]AWB81791.1 phosphatidylglycerophosphate synthase [Corynebacterium yudongzhengii]PWC01056.1 CDP-alcohol phosphatidyltransferase family protein [Corynebacterium yudongzhengii]